MMDYINSVKRATLAVPEKQAAIREFFEAEIRAHG